MARSDPRQMLYHPDMTRDEMVLLAREWFDVHGEPPRALDWNAGELRRRGMTKERRAFVDGGWPTVNEIRREFGTFTDFIVICGFYPRQTRPLWRSTPLAKRAFYLRAAVLALKSQLNQVTVESEIPS